jgi:hypothetical protein
MDRMETAMEDETKKVLTDLLSPVVAIALIILAGVFILIGAAIFGLDKGVLGNMAKHEYARGLITYLFSVVTIGTAVVLVVYSLTSAPGDKIDERFQRGKEILSLLLGVFGAIVGFYFGSAIEGAERAGAASLRLTPPLLSQALVVGGQHVTVTAAVSGGVPPYRYQIKLGDKMIAEQQPVKEGGWIVQDQETPSVKTDTVMSVHLTVVDATGTTLSTGAQLQILAR